MDGDQEEFLIKAVKMINKKESVGKSKKFLLAGSPGCGKTILGTPSPLSILRWQHLQSVSYSQVLPPVLVI